MSSSNLWNYRIDHDGHDATFGTRLGAFLHSYLLPLVDKMIVAKEISRVTKKLHYHIYAIFKDSQIYITLKKNFDKRFPFHTGNMKSLAKVKKPVINLAYTCKDKHFITFKGYTLQELEAYGDLWVPKKTRTKMDNVVEKVVEYALNEGYDLSTFKDCATVVYNFYKANKKLMNFKHMQSLVRNLQSEGDYENGLDDFYDFCAIIK